MTEEKKIKIGLFLNKVCTVLAVLFFLVTCVVMTLVKFKVYLALVITIAVLFGICSVASHFLLKDYKPEK